MRRKVLFIILGLVIVLIIHNYFEDRRADLRDEISAIQKRLLKAEAKIDLPQLKSSPEVTPIEGTTTGALSRLQAILTEDAKASGIKILSLRPAPVIKYSYHEGVTLYIEAKGSVEEVSDFLERIKSIKKAVFISKLNLMRASTEDPEELRITMEITGLRRL